MTAPEGMAARLAAVLADAAEHDLVGDQWTSEYVEGWRIGRDSTLARVAAALASEATDPAPPACTCDPGPEGQHRDWCEKEGGFPPDPAPEGDREAVAEVWDEGVRAAFRGAISRQNADDVKRWNPYRTPSADTCPSVCVETNHPGREHADWTATDPPAGETVTETVTEADAWDEGYARGLRQVRTDGVHPTNPYRKPVDPEDG